MNVKHKLISILNKLPYVRGLYKENIRLHQQNMSFLKNTCFPPGHFYSTIISVDNIKKRQNEIWSTENLDEGIKGINLNKDEQIKLIKQLECFYSEIPFTTNKSDDKRFYYENDFYSYSDAIVLFSMIRNFKPKQIIEIGSGFSSSIMLDTNEHFFNNSIKLTFIEPNTDRLKSVLKIMDYEYTTIIENEVQNIESDVFEKLDPGDILFIDSSHVVKTGSDVNYILFEILPKLKSGVLIHFHDIFYPFEYPKDWVFKGWNWNEAYFLKAFLMYNTEFEIKLFSNYLHKHHKHVFNNMPLCFKIIGCSLWLLKK